MHLPQGFIFCPGDCVEVMDEVSFYSARKRLVEVGFIEKRDYLKSLVPGEPDIFSESARWKKYKPSESEMKRLERARQRGQKRVLRGRYRRNAFLRKNPNLNRTATVK
ncbi:MAG TPA: hypothetical protein ENN29_13495 [Candidatus Hydrogenedentes bacterium]|nr:hypothetical protein [Candidatus Hydrogenedentota bacterium]